MGLFCIWHDYRYWAIILFDTIPNPAYDLEAKVMDLEIYGKVLCQTFQDLLTCKSLYGFTLYLA